MGNNYFEEALHNFSSDVAYGGQIRHLYDLGYSTAKIQSHIDYPVSYELVRDYLWTYLVKSKKVVFNEHDICPISASAQFRTEYDKYGHKSFRLVETPAHPVSEYSSVNVPSSIDLTNLSHCFATINCPELKLCSDINVYQSILNTKQFEYLSGFPWPEFPVYICLNDSLADILNTLHQSGLWSDKIIDPDNSFIYNFR